MSSENNCMQDYKRFMENRSKNNSNITSQSTSNTLQSSDLRNKINSKQSQRINNSDNIVKEYRRKESNESDSRKRKNENNKKVQHSSNKEYVQREFINNNLNKKSENLLDIVNNRDQQIINSLDSSWNKRRDKNIEKEWQRRESDGLEWRNRKNKNENKKEILQSAEFELYKEYVQWDFINNKLYEKGVNLLNIRTNREQQEFTNTLQRWFIFINEDFNEVPKYEYYKILPNIQSEHPAAQFLRAAIIEKQFVTEEDADEKVKRILKFIFQSHSQVIPHNLTEPLHVEYDPDRCIVVVNKFQSPEVPRIKLLVEKGGIIASARMLLRYESFGNGSYQWGDPKEVHKVLHDLFKVRYEGFASPVNSRFIEYNQTYFCSLFPDTDEVFGSLGNFFNVDMEQHCGGWSVNPPFLNDLMKNVALRIEQILDDGHKCYFFCTFPWWDDDEGWNILNDSRHLIKRFDLLPQHFIVQDAYGNKFEPKMSMNLFVMGELPSDVARLTELGNILVLDPITALPDDCPW